MAIKKGLLALLADKPEIFARFPAEVLSGKQADSLLQIPRLAAAEICGPGDVERLCGILPRYRPDGLLPTISYTGTEFGRWDRLLEVAADLKKAAEKELHIYVADPVVLGAPRLWGALRRAHERRIPERFGFAAPCLGCRMYCLMLRVPLCKAVGARYFVPSRAGLEQKGCPGHCRDVEKKYFSYLMSGCGIEVWYQPEAGDAPPDDTVPRCVLSGAREDEAATERLVRYFESFALPAAGGILSRALSGAAADYDDLITAVAQPLKQGST